MSNIRCPHDWGKTENGPFWRCAVCKTVTSAPDWLSPRDYPENICGETAGFAVCREPKGHDGAHSTGDRGEASAVWFDL